MAKITHISNQANTPKRKKKKKKKQLLFSSRTLCLLLVPILIVIGFTIRSSGQEQIDELTHQRDALSATQDVLIKDRDYLQSRIELLKNPEYLLAYAKQRLKYLGENEILFLFPED